MRKIALILCLLLNSFWSFGLSDTLLKKDNLYLGVNFSSLKLINEYSIINKFCSSCFSGKWQEIKGMPSFELSIFSRIHVKEKIFITPTISFGNMQFLNNASYSQYEYETPKTSVGADIYETVNILKLYLTLGKIKYMKKHNLFFDAGLGLNQVLSVKDDLKLKVRLNSENLTTEKLENLFLDCREFYKIFNRRLFLKFSSGINFKISNKLFLNTSVLLETSYSKSIEDLDSDPGIARINRFAIYPGFSLGLMLKK